MGRQHVRDGVLYVTQQKTRRSLAIPVLPELAATIEATASQHLTFLVTSRGSPFPGGSFSRAFRKWCDEAALPPECSVHGLRKAACRRLAEARLLGSRDRLAKRPHYPAVDRPLHEGCRPKAARASGCGAAQNRYEIGEPFLTRFAKLPCNPLKLNNRRNRAENLFRLVDLPWHHGPPSSQNHSSGWTTSAGLDQYDHQIEPCRTSGVNLR